MRAIVRSPMRLTRPTEGLEVLFENGEKRLPLESRLLQKVIRLTSLQAARRGVKGHRWKGAELHKEQTEAFSQD
jgi:hypothetical protein